MIVDGKILTAYRHTGLIAGDQRHYRISAINSGGTGPASDVVSADTVPRGTVELSVDAASVAEGGAVTWTVTATTPEDTEPETGFEMEVEVTTTDGTAKAGTDYTALDETVTFRRADFARTDTGSAVYRWVATKTGTVAVTEEGEVEAEEQFALNASIVTAGVAFTIGTGEVEIAIPNTDTWGITVTSTPGEILEGVTREVVLTAQVTPADQGCVANFPFTLRLSVGGTATDPDDYTIDTAPADMDVEACATEATWRVTVAAALDTEDDANETVTFTPEIVGDVDFAPEAADLVPAQVTITEGPGVALSTLSLRVLERNSSTYTVALTSQPTGTVTVTPSVSGDPDVTLSPASLSFTPTTWHVAQAVTVSAAKDPDETDDEAVIRHAVAGANYGSVTADDVEVRVQDIDGKVTGDLRMVGSENENEGRLEMFYQGDWGTICDDRFSNWIRPKGGGPAEPNQASKVACRIMGYEGGNTVSGHDWWSRASVSEQPIWLDDVACLASIAEHNAGDDDTPVSLSDCYNAGPALHNCSHREDVGVRCTGTLTRPADVRGPGAPQAVVQSTRRTITLSFEENLATEANRLPPLSSFELTVDAKVTPIASFTGPGRQGLGDNQIRLVVDETLPTGMRIYVYYTDPSGNNDTAAIQDDAGNDVETFFVAAMASGQPGQATERAGVAAEFRDVPERHDGSTALSFELAFGEPVDVTGENLRTEALQVTGGAITSVTKIDPSSNQHWQITITPSNNEAITVALPAGTLCEEAGTVCTSDGRGLADPLDAEIAGPETVTHVVGAAVTSGPGNNGVWDAGEIVTAVVKFSGTVSVQGPPGVGPTLAIALDDTRREAAYTGGSGTTTLEFSHTVGEDDAGASTARVLSNGLSLNGTVIGDDRGEQAQIEFSLEPVVTSVELAADTSGDNIWTEGETIEARLTFSEAVTVADGTPTIGITIAGEAGALDYASGSETTTIRFSRAVTSQDGDLSQIAVTADSLALGAATIVSTASGLEAELAHDGTAATPAPETRTGLTASFEGLPESHGGAEISFTLTFSEEFSLSWKTLQGYEDTPSAFQIGNGSVTRTSRVTQGENQAWNITVTPTGSSDVTITLPATTDCAAAGAICTGDDRPLSAAVSATVPQTAPIQVIPVTPLTVSFEVSPPEEHDGATEFTFHIAFSEDLDSYSWKTLQKTSLRIQQGSSKVVPKVRRLVQGSSQRWEVKVTPSSKEDITIGIGPSPACTDPAAMCTAGDKAVSNAISKTVLGPPGLSVADATVEEASGATVDFDVSMSRASTSTVSVDYATKDGTATAGADYTSTSGTLTFSPGETEKTVEVPVINDGLDEGSETFTFTLSNPSGGNAYLADATATGTITNDDPMPREWLSRFGRTVASQVVDAIGSRLDGGSGTHLRIGGMELNAQGALVEENDTPKTGLEALKWHDQMEDTSSMTGRELLFGSSFQLSTGGEDGAPAFTGWGHFSVGGFDAETNELRLDGRVDSGFVGADIGRERWLAGLILGISKGDGEFTMTESGNTGEVESSLTALYPYGKIAVNERVDLWGIVGLGSGDLTLTQHANPATGRDKEEVRETDIDMRMGAVGVKGNVISADETGGLSVDVKSDAFIVQTNSDRVQGLEAAETDVSRVRLIVVGSRAFDTGNGTLVPSAEIGLRHDGGDAETGTGLEIGGGLRFEAEGFSIEGTVRTLVAHEESGYDEWGASGAIRLNTSASGRGLSLSLTPTWGAAGSGVDQLWTLTDTSQLANGEFEAERRLEAELGYGIGVPRTRGLVTPYAGLSLGEGGDRTYRTGARWRVAPEATLGLEATREERGEEDTASAVIVRAQVSW